MDVVGRARGVPVSLAYFYEVVEREHPELVDSEPDPHAPSRPKWQHDLRWELQTAVSGGLIRKREDVGRGYYSSLVTAGERDALIGSARLRPVEALGPEAVAVETPAAVRTRRRLEGELVARYTNFCSAEGRSLGRIEMRTSEADRLVADLYDVQLHQLIEAKATPDRASVRMGLGQLFDYAHQIGTGPRLALLLPGMPSQSLASLVASLGVDLIVEVDDTFEVRQAPAAPSPESGTGFLESS